MNNKLVVLLCVASIGFTACQKKPDPPAPVPSVAGKPQPPQPPPVTNCQGATIMYNMPVVTQNTGTAVSYVIPNFETSCGDTLQVFIKNIALAPTDPWTELFDDSHIANYYSLTNQTVTVYNNTSNTVYVEIQAVLK